MPIINTATAQIEPKVTKTITDFSAMFPFNAMAALVTEASKSPCAKELNAATETRPFRANNADNDEALLCWYCAS